jgi:putative DNA primase/helicase
VVEANDPSGRYLRRRVGLTSFPSCLRTAFNVRYQSDCPSFHPAMIAMVTGPDGASPILHRTYLTVDGHKAPVTQPRRLMPGTFAKGAAIRLGPAGEALGIAEGIETALSASALFGVSCWAAVSAGMLAAWQPPSEAKRIIVFGDNDESYDGQAAAYALARRLRCDRCTVEVHVPADPGADWNDVHQLQINAAGVLPDASISDAPTINPADEPDFSEPYPAHRGRVEEHDGVFLHFCAECGAWGAFGYGVSLRTGKLGRWYCAAHRPRGAVP